MAINTLASRLSTLPLVLAGPVLRNVTPKSVTVWVALKAASSIKLTIKDESGTALGNGTLSTIADKLFPRILGLLREFGVPCRYGFNPEDAPLFGGAAPLVDHALILFAADLLAGAPAEAGVILAFSSAEQGDLGLVATPYSEARSAGVGSARDFPVESVGHRTSDQTNRYMARYSLSDIR